MVDRCTTCGAEEGAIYPYTGREVTMIAVSRYVPGLPVQRWCCWTCHGQATADVHHSSAEAMVLATVDGSSLSQASRPNVRTAA